jgi:hypothetical protein
MLCSPDSCQCTVQAEARQTKNVLRCGHIAGEAAQRLCLLQQMPMQPSTCASSMHVPPPGSTCCNAYNTGILVLRNRPATLELMDAWHQRLASPDAKEACV